MMQPVASQDLRYGGSGDTLPTVAINAAGGLLFAALFTADQRAADTRISRRDKVPSLAEGPAAFLIMTAASDPRHSPPGMVPACSSLLSAAAHTECVLTAIMQMWMQSIREASISAQGEHTLPRRRMEE